MKFWPGCLSLKHNKEVYCLFGIFFALVAIKSALTIPLQTPWIFADEVVYDNIAQNILDGTFLSDLQYCQTYPPGYSTLLSIAYLFPGDKTVIYHIMLIINTILTSSIIFPSYFILKKYISQNQALLGSVLISVLPAVTLYNFVLMSENLFIPLTMFSIWFLHEAFETNKLRWSFLAGFSIFYLYFTRETGLVFCIALLVALAFFILNTERGARLKAVKDKVLMLCSFAIPFLLWLTYKKIIAVQPSLYNTDSYVSTLSGSFLDIELFETFSTLMLHEIEYLALSAYVTVFVISLIFIVGCILKPNLFGFKDHIEHFCSDKILTLQSIIIYSLTSGAGLLVITVTHMQKAYLAGNQEYAIFGRYIDPIVPVIFLFGVLGIGFLYPRCKGLKWKSEIIGFLGVLIILLFASTLPHTYYKFPNMLSIYYILPLQNYMSYSLTLILLAIIFVIVPYCFLKNYRKSHISTILVVFFITLSVILSIPAYANQYNVMQNTENENQIGRYLQEYSSPETQILMDRENFNQYWGPQMWFLTKFWTKGELVRKSTADDPSGVRTKEFVSGVDYILSKKLLPYPCVNASRGGYKLYMPHSAEQPTQFSMPYMLDIGHNDSHIVSGFHNAENGKIRWTTDFAEVKIEYPKEKGSFVLQIKTGGHRPEVDPANISFFINGHIIGAIEKASGTKICSVVVPEYYLENNYQIIGIKTNTWKPSDYGSADKRDLGIQVDWVELNPVYFDGMYEPEHWDSIPTRWISSNATLPIYSDENRTIDLTFRATSFHQLRTLKIYCNNIFQGQQTIPKSFVNVSAQIQLQKGENIIRFHVPEGAERPCDIPGLNNPDTRWLSVAVQNVTITEAS